MKSISKLVFLLFLVNITLRISGQEIKVTEFRIDPRDISARENAVLDANGDACAIIKLRTGVQNLKFSTDMGIRKIENHDGEYWLWVSPNTSRITIESEEIEEIEKLEYKLPAFTEEYNVYVIILSAILPDRTIYTSINSIKVETKPSKAEVYIDKAFMGYSPININITSDTFQYEIRKKRYTPVINNFKYNEIQKEIFVSLKKRPEANRWYLIVYGSGGNKYGLFWGVETGKIGKTGWYILFAPPVRSKKYIATVSGYTRYIDKLVIPNSTLVVDRNNFNSIVGEPSDNYYIKLKDNNNTFYNHFRLKAGISQRILHDTYIKIGFGYASVNQWFRLNVIPYSNDPLLEIPLKNTYYGKREYVINMLTLETGLAFRLSNRYLVNLNISTTGFSNWYSTNTYSLILPLEGSIGVGYNF